jgi:hypothetical protein
MDVSELLLDVSCFASRDEETLLVAENSVGLQDLFHCSQADSLIGEVISLLIHTLVLAFQSVLHST